MHQRRVSRSLGVEVPDAKDKWMLNPKNQSSHEESHISMCQSLLNQAQSDLEIKSKNWSYGLKYPKSQPLRVKAKARAHVTTLIKTKRNEETTIYIVQAQIKEMYSIFNLEYRHATLSRGMLHMLPTKSQCITKAQKLKWDEWNTIATYTLYISLNQGKSKCPISQIRGSGLGRFLQRLVFKFRMFQFLKPSVLIFTG
jgi:hypothetical protein